MTFFLRELTVEELERQKRIAVKSERRTLRKTLMKLARKHLSLQLRMHSTVAQEKSYARRIVDQLLAGKNPGLVETLP